MITMKHSLAFISLFLLGFSLTGQPILPYLCGDNKYSYLDLETDKLILPCQFEEAEPFNQYGLAAVKVQGEVRVIRKDGAFLSDAVFSGMPEFKLLPRNTVYLNSQSKADLKPLLQVIDTSGQFLLLNMEDGYCTDRLFKLDAFRPLFFCGNGGTPPRVRHGNEFFQNHLRAFQLNKGFTFIDLNGRPLFGKEAFKVADELGDGFFTLADSAGNLALANADRRLTGFSYIRMNKLGEFIVGYPTKTEKKYKDQAEKALHFLSEKFQLLDTQGKVILDTTYFYPKKAVDPNLLIVYKKGKGYEYGGSGVISTDCKVVIPFSNWKLTSATADLFIAQKDYWIGKFGIVAKDGRTVQPIEFDNIEKCHNLPYFLFYRKPNMGVMDSTGRILFERPCSIMPVSKNLFTYKIGEKTGLLSANGVNVLPAEYESIREFRGDSLFLVCKDKLCGVMDTHGKVLLPLRYTSIDWDNLRKVCLAYEPGHPAYFDAQFVKMAPFVERFGNNPKETGVFLGQDYRQGYLNANGDTIIPPIYSKIKEYFTKDSVPFFLFETKTSKGILDKNGRSPLPIGWKTSEGYWFSFIDGSARICIENGTEGGIIDHNGQWLLTPRVGEFSFLNKFLLEKKEGKYRILDSLGMPVIAEMFDFVSGWHKSPIIVGQNIPGETYSDTIQGISGKKDSIVILNRLKLGCLDENGNWLIPMQYNYLVERENGLFIASLGWKEGKIKSYLLDRTGREILKTKYDALELYSETLIATKNKKKGIIDFKGKVLLPIIYEQIKFLYAYRSNGLTANPGLRYAHLIVRKNGKYLLLDQFGEIILADLNGDEDVSYYDGPFLMKLQSFPENVSRYFLHDTVGHGLHEVESFKRDYPNPGYGILTMAGKQVWIHLESGKLLKK